MPCVIVLRLNGGPGVTADGCVERPFAAVTFVVGNSHNLSPSLFMPGTTISATIANDFAEATTEIHQASLILLGLLLFVITFIVLALSKVMLVWLEQRQAGGDAGGCWVVGPAIAGRSFGNSNSALDFADGGQVFVDLAAVGCPQATA